MPSIDLSFLPDKNKDSQETTPINADSVDLSFLPDKSDTTSTDTAQSKIDLSFLPDKPKEKFTYDKFVDILRKTQSGTVGIIKAETEALQGKRNFNLFKTPIEEYKKAFSGEKYTSSREIFEDIGSVIEQIPDAKTQSSALNMALNLPKPILKEIARMPEVALDFITDPTGWLLAGASPVAKGIGVGAKALKIEERIQPFIQKLSKTPIGEKLSEWLVYRGGQSKEYQKIAEDALYNIKEAKAQAESIGTALSSVGKAEQQRIGQLMAGGVSVSAKEAPLRALAESARTSLDDIEKLAKDTIRYGETPLLSETTYKTKLTANQLNELRLKKDVLNKQIEGILGTEKRNKLIQLSGNIKIQGLQGLRTDIIKLRNDLMVNKDKSLGVIEKQLGEGVDSYLDKLINISRTNRVMAIDKLSDFAGRAETISNASGSGRMKQLSDSIFNFIDKIDNTNELRKIQQLTDKVRYGTAEKLINTVEGQASEVIPQASQIGIKTQDVKITGIKPLIEELSKSSRFKGKAKLLNDIADELTDIDKRIKMSYKYGGTPYNPRLFREFEESKRLGGIFGNKPMRVKGERFLQREDISDEARKYLREIKEPAYPTAKAIAQTSHDIEMSKLFNKVAENPNWVSPVEREGFTFMKGSPKDIGNLSGKYVNNAIAKDVNEMTRASTKFDDIYNPIHSAWKFAKTVASPATHFRNIMSNSILLDLSGIDQTTQMRLLPMALKDLIGKGKYFAEAKQARLLGNEFYGSEIKELLNNYEKSTSIFDAIGKTIKSGMNKIGKIYQAEEQVFKLAKFISEREKGVTVEMAAKEAEKWLFNYDKVSKLVKTMRKSPFGAPFITFTSKALPRIAETAIKNPFRIGKYSMLIKAMENRSIADLGLTEGQVRDIKKNRRGINMILPWKDENGKVQTLDISYILPWGDIGEQGGILGLPPAIAPFSAPLAKSAIEVISNRNLFLNDVIWNDRTDSTEEKAKKIGNHLMKNAVPLPSWAPGGYTWDKLTSAMLKKKDYFGRVRGMPKVLLDVIGGIKISPVDLGKIRSQEFTQMNRDIEDIRGQLKRDMMNRGISQEEKQKLLQDANRKIRAVQENKMTINELFRVILGGSEL